jgi:undecaprenyl-diphosphatase
MDELGRIVMLAVIQGVAEFLPISSSGHVVLAAALMSGDETQQLDVADVNIVLHVGTLLSILVFYGQRVLRLLAEDRRTIGLLIVGTVPAVVLGVPVKLFASDLLASPLIAGLLLIVTGLILLWVSRRPRRQRDYTALSVREAIWIGLSQAAAILPGLSRSGATISAGLRLGLSPGAAATFSFLLAIPVIAGGGLVEIISLLGHHSELGTPLSYLLLGATISFVVGLLALWWLIRWLQQGRLQWFAYWCIPVGVIAVAWQLWP